MMLGIIMGSGSNAAAVINLYYRLPYLIHRLVNYCSRGFSQLVPKCIMLLPIAHGYLLNLLLPNKLSDHGENSMRFICYVCEWGATCYL